MFFIAIWAIYSVPMLLFPLKYEAYVYKYSDEFSLEPELVFSVIRAESKFDKYAKSKKGAIGLMQLMYPTANDGAIYLAIDGFNEKMLYDPEINIRIGSWYLNRLFRQHGRFELVLASYNAGGSKVRTWFSGVDYSEYSTNEFLNHIPYPETRAFVRGVMNNYKMYHKRLKER